MRIRPSCCLLAFLLITASCRQFLPEGADLPPESPPPPTPAESLATAERLARTGKLEAAQEALATLPKEEIAAEDVARLQKTLDARAALKQQATDLEAVLPGSETPREHRALQLAAKRRLSQARKLLKAGQFAAAQEHVTPLIGTPLIQREVQDFLLEVNHERTMAALRLAQSETTYTAMAEVEDRMRLPATYGKTVVIDGDLKPPELPPGRMEQLVSQKVTLNFPDAIGVKDLLLALNRLDQVNFIADETLTEEQQITLNVVDVPLVEVLSYVARNMGVAFHVGENTIWVTESDEPPGTGPELETHVYRLRSGFIPSLGGGGGGGGGGDDDGGFGGGMADEDTDLEDVLDAFLADGPEGATYRIYRNRNLLVIKNSRENLRLAEELLKEFDREPYQVLIEARFINISQEDLSELGFDIPEFALDGRDADDTAALMSLSAASTFEGFKNATVGSNISIAGILGNHTYEAVLHALEETGRSRTLSAPRITVLNNQTARIRKGDVMYYFEEYDIETTPGGDGADTNSLVPTGTPTELKLGITLEVKVNIGNDGKTIILALHPEITEFIEWLNFEVSGAGGEDDGGDNQDTGDSQQPAGLVSLPRTNESTLSTAVAVNSGETVVLGGTLETRKTRNVSKVPLLGDIPYIGVLFRHTEEVDEPQHLLIFVTATVIGKSGEFLDIRQSDDTSRQVQQR